jgi:hypothetical protein
VKPKADYVYGYVYGYVHGYLYGHKASAEGENVVPVC